MLLKKMVALDFIFIIPWDFLYFLEKLKLFYRKTERVVKYFQ